MVETNSDQIQIIEVHNVVTVYGLEEDGSIAETGFMQLSRPQDWGNKDRWHYEFFKLEWIYQGTKYINNCHCWTDLKDPEQGYPPLFAQGIAMILMPGTPPELCGREYLHGDDFWRKSWGEMPPYYDPRDDDEFEDDEVYE
ncbi:hypothetical protein [Nostoc sp. NZL]|uniref:hypothetical protein n=1 Tax=Nostoc sp. NZL TaxID=2650612 RepID=UPI0018C72317|nr:hypothetical protein [Nostoc sp. NZL]MBG1240997.1 hypothetical protein [Nostoc sp. NZL]